MTTTTKTTTTTTTTTTSTIVTPTKQESPQPEIQENVSYFLFWHGPSTDRPPLVTPPRDPETGNAMVEILPDDELLEEYYILDNDGRFMSEEEVDRLEKEWEEELEEMRKERREWREELRKRR